MGRSRKHKAGRQRAKGRQEKKPIDPVSAYAGVLGTRGNARRLFNDALLLHGRERFRGAIPLAILAIEESLKGVELGASFRRLRDIPIEEQKWMTSHKHKLGHVPGRDVEIMEDELMRDFHAVLVREGKAPHEGGRPVSLENIAEGTRRRRDLVKNLQHVKEMCVYEGWDAEAGSWRSLDIDDDEAEALSVFVLAIAMEHYDELHARTELDVDALVPRFPALEECREEKAGLDPLEVDPDKVQRGEAVLRGIYGKIGVRGAAAKRGAGG